MDVLRADGRRNRRAILDAAVSAVLADGDLGHSEVARRAGVTRATVYRHFPDRDALMHEVVRELASTYLTPLLEEMDRLPAPEAWRLLATVAVERGREHVGRSAISGEGLERLAGNAVADEPVEAFLRRRRERGEPVGETPTTGPPSVCPPPASRPLPTPSARPRSASTCWCVRCCG